MESEIIIVVARSLERLGIVFISGLSLCFGYRLFSIVTHSNAKGMIEGGGFKFKFSNSGPGVFFAGFGTLVLVYALLSDMEIGPPNNGDADDEDIWVRYAQEGETPSYKSSIGALNRLELISDQAKMGGFNESDQEKLIESIEKIRPVRSLLVNAEFGEEGVYSEYKMIMTLCREDPIECENYLKVNNKKGWFEHVDDFNTFLD